MCSCDVENFVNKLALNKSVSPEEAAQMVNNAIKDRAFLFYFTWKTLQDMHPEIDADKVMAEASRRLGDYKASALGEIKDAAEAIMKQTSKAGMLVFDQEITKLTPTESEKLIHRCPHIEAFKDLGCSDEEISKLCKKLLMPLDFAMLAQHKNIKLEFPKNLADDDICIMHTTMTSK